MSRPLFLLALLAAGIAQAADPAKLLKRTGRGDSAERIEALHDLTDADADAAREVAVRWLGGERDASLRAAAARALWDLKEAARPAEPALRAALDDADEDTVYNAIGALDGLGVPDADLRTARLALVQRSHDAFHVLYAARALYPDAALSLGQYLDAAFDALNLAATDTSRYDKLREAAREGLLRPIAKERGRAGFEALVEAFPRESPPVREAIAYVLDAVPAEVGDPQRIAALLEGSAAYTRHSLLGALGDYGARAQPVLGAIIEQLDTRNEPVVREAAAAALKRVADVPAGLDEMQRRSAWRSQVETRIVPALARTVADDPTPDVRKAAASALEDLKLWAAPAAPQIAAHIAAQPDLWARYALVHVCGWGARAGQPCARDALQKIADSDPDDAVQRDAREALATSADLLH